MASLFDRRLLVVTGKGGVGKSTVSAALALAAARKGKRVLVCEVNTKERISTLLETRAAGHEVHNIAPNIDAVNVAPPEAMREYVLMKLKMRRVYEAVFENRLVRYFLRAIPSLAELVMLGKILYHVEERLLDGRYRWDLVVMDAPATGHGITMLRIPQVMLDTVPAGPVQNDARWMRDSLLHPQLSAVVLVTIPESMPVNETIELHRAMRDVVKIPGGALVFNGTVKAAFSPEERERIRSAPPELQHAAKAVMSREARAEQTEHYRERVEKELPLPLVEVPHLFTHHFGREEIERIADILERA